MSDGESALACPRCSQADAVQSVPSAYEAGHALIRVRRDRRQPAAWWHVLSGIALIGLLVLGAAMRSPALFVLDGLLFAALLAAGST